MEFTQWGVLSAWSLSEVEEMHQILNRLKCTVALESLREQFRQDFILRAGEMPQLVFATKTDDLSLNQLLKVDL